MRTTPLGFHTLRPYEYVTHEDDLDRKRRDRRLRLGLQRKGMKSTARLLVCRCGRRHALTTYETRSGVTTPCCGTFFKTGRGKEDRVRKVNPPLRKR